MREDPWSCELAATIDTWFARRWCLPGADALTVRLHPCPTLKRWHNMMQECPERGVEAALEVILPVGPETC